MHICGIDCASKEPERRRKEDGNGQDPDPDFGSKRNQGPDEWGWWTCAACWRLGTAGTRQRAWMMMIGVSALSTPLAAIRKDGAYVDGEEKVRTGEMSEDEFI